LNLGQRSVEPAKKGQLFSARVLNGLKFVSPAAFPGRIVVRVNQQ